MKHEVLPQILLCGLLITNYFHWFDVFMVRTRVSNQEYFVRECLDDYGLFG